jgi:uncharacterized protein YbjQ (UPF0145 family)
MDPAYVTTLDALPGFRVARALGLVHGVGKQADGGMKLGVAVDTRLSAACDEARAVAVAAMMRAALAVGGHAIVGVRYELSAWVDGAPVFLAYGTAVAVEAGG